MRKSSTRRNFSFIGKKQKFRRRETKVSSRWNKSFSSVELMQLLRDVFFVLGRTLLAEKVDTFERHIHKKGCLEYCLFMYSVAFFHSEIRKCSPLNSHRFTKNRFESVIPLQKSQKNMFYNMLVLQTLIKSSQKNFKKSGRKVWSVIIKPLPLHPLPIRKATHKERKILEIMQTNK